MSLLRTWQTHPSSSLYKMFGAAAKSCVQSFLFNLFMEGQLSGQSLTTRQPMSMASFFMLSVENGPGILFRAESWQEAVLRSRIAGAYVNSCVST